MLDAMPLVVSSRLNEGDWLLRALSLSVSLSLIFVYTVHHQDYLDLPYLDLSKPIRQGYSLTVTNCPRLNK